MWRRRTAQPLPGPGWQAGQDESAVAGSTDGWLAAPPRSAAVTTVMKVGMWVALGCGPVALIAALPGSAAPSQAPAVAVAGRSPVGPAGFAQLYVAAYLQAGSGDATLRAFYPAAPDVASPASQRQAMRTVTVAAVEVSGGYWSIMVAADVAVRDKKGGYANAGTHYFQVAVRAVGDSASGATGPAGISAGYVATALPAEVGPPAVAPPPALAYDSGASVGDGPLSDTIREFTTAYLTGSGDLARDLSPGTTLAPISPPPYRQVTVIQIIPATMSKTTAATAGGVPADGTRLHVLVEVQVTDTAGSVSPLDYALTVAARAGRWEVASLDAAPMLANSAPPTLPVPAPKTGPDSSTSDSPGASPTGDGVPPTSSPPEATATPSP